jgi:hypothetical protein
MEVVRVQNPVEPSRVESGDVNFLQQKRAAFVVGEKPREALP